MNGRAWLLVSITLAAAGTIPLPPACAGIEGTPHDLFATGYGTGNPCRYCHTPHAALTGTPLWNHKLSDAVYGIYQSTSLDADLGQPTGASKLCLSCHDGTVAVSETLRRGSGSLTYIPPGTTNLGTDLSDDHPVSFVYSPSLTAQDLQLRTPQEIPQELKLDKYGELQCTTCHDPHENRFGDFLVMENTASRLCTSCHNMKGWITAAHQSSPATVGLADDAYLQAGPHTTVAQAACLSCHRPHSAGGHERLLHFASLEDNCLNCHNGTVARANLEASLNKISRHDVRGYVGVHDLVESPTSAARHVECTDCHNPHAARSDPVRSPQLPGELQGVSGLTISGNATDEAGFEYEVCFKCHADSPDRLQSRITRQITQSNTRLEFDPGNPSFHPVVAPGNSRDVPSLLPGLTPSSRINCTDCHNSDDPSSAQGPHGSRYPALLAYRYETADNTRESDYSYELCYQCHSRNSILADESFGEHGEHLEEDIPCSACHDPHGISNAQGNRTNNSHLINFDVSIVGPDPRTARLEFEDLGTFRGRCYLNCHNKAHSPESY